MCGITCGIATTIVGAVVAVVISVVGYAVVPGIIDNIVITEMVLYNDTIQLERFEALPFPLNFTVRIWSVTNVQEVMQGGVPVMEELGPYIYRVYQTRVMEKFGDDFLNYRIRFNFEFDAESSFPNTEDDMVTIVNVPYHAILQVAEQMFPELMGVLGLALSGIFGQHNSPFMTVRVRDFLFDGIRLCENPGLIGGVACSQVRALSADAQNIQEQEDGSLLFSLLSYRDGTLSELYVANRGLADPADLARIHTYADLPHLLNWIDGDEGRGSGLCNMINGTDSGVFAPFIDRDRSLYALNTDICRSVELRYQYETEYEGISAVRYALNEWFLDNHEECFCLNVTKGINRDNGCLLEGAMEIYTCVGAYLVMSYPHFLYADSKYRNGVIGMNSVEEDHRIFLDIEPLTGTIIRGQKRAQFNIFTRPVTSISATQNLRTTLTPIAWFEEGMSLPEDLVDEIKTRLLMPLRLVDILIPVVIAISAVVVLLGIVIVIKYKRNKVSPMATSSPVPTTRTIELK